MDRRQFIGSVSKAGGGLLLASHFPGIINALNSDKQNGKLGVALVGLGGYATSELAPALLETKNCYLAGIVTGTPAKEQVWAKKYNISAKNIYNYNNFDSIAKNKSIDIVYVVLPNSMHAEYTIRAARAGKHVISEKPMATSVEDCKNMIEACSKAEKKLSIGYRLYFEPFNRKMMELGQLEQYGKLLQISAGHAYNADNPNVWRMNKKLAGGGPLMDLGIYCLEGALYTAGELPTYVTAKNTTKNKDFFKEVEGTLEWEMQFPSGLISKCKTSYEDKYNYLNARAQKGNFRLTPAYTYGGLKGETPEGPMDLPHVNQQALQMDNFAQCIKENKPSIVPGEMGLRDVYIMEKIYEASETGKTVTLKNVPDYLYKFKPLALVNTSSIIG